VGERKPTLRPKDDWIVLHAEQLRIVSDDLWASAHERLSTSRQAYVRTNPGKLFGKPGNGIESKYLLTGLATCGACGGSLTVRFSSRRHHRHRFYHCLTNVQRGPSVCANGVGLPMEEIDARVLTMFEGQLLDPDAVRAGVQEAVRQISLTSAPRGAKRGTRAAQLGEITSREFGIRQNSH
jgi:site-specific DNA recombinase